MLAKYGSMQFFSDKQAIVLDIGSAYTKFGYAGEPEPRGIIKSEVFDPDTKKKRKIYEYNDLDDFYQLLVEFLHEIFFRHVIISPKDKKVVFLESLLLPTKIRETIAKVLFRHFEIGSIMMLPTHLASVSTLGVDTALVLDIGYEEATVIPIFEGVPLLKAWQALPLAGKLIHKNMKDYLENIIPKPHLTEELLEEIKVQTCFVTTMERAIKFNAEMEIKPAPDVKYTTTKTFTIPGILREKAYEVLWEGNDDNISLATMLIHSLLKCPIDTRRPLAENILLIGGTSLTKGLTARLKEELHSNSILYENKLCLRTFKFHSAPCKAIYTAWLGGAICGVVDSPSRYITQYQYIVHKRIRDWVNLLDNQPKENSNDDEV